MCGYYQNSRTANVILWTDGLENLIKTLLLGARWAKKKAEKKTHKTNALENYQIKNDFSSKHFLLVFVEPDAVLLMKLIIL